MSSQRKEQSKTVVQPSTETNANAMNFEENQNETTAHDNNNQRPLLIRVKPLSPLNEYYDTSADCYTETSGSRVRIKCPQVKHFKSKLKREAMEKRRIQLLKLPMESSDSSLDEATRVKKHRPPFKPRVRYSRRSSQRERESFWKHFNHFLSKSLEDVKRSQSSTTSSSEKSS